MTVAVDNFAPIAVADGIFDTRGEIPIRISSDRLLRNDIDPDGDELQITAVGQGDHGTVSINDNGRVTYIAESGFIGDDQFIYQISDGVATAEAVVSVSVGEPYDNVESGDAGSDILIGDFTGDNYLSGGRGNDILLSGRGDDFLRGGAGSDLLFSGSGDDTLRGGAGSDVLFAGRGDDIAAGGSGDDLIFGGRGDDRIIGGRGDDLLFGGSGSDVFVFRTGDGSDSILDFQTARSGRRFSIEGDQIRLSVIGVSDFDDLLALGQQEGNGVLFDFGNGDELFLSGTQLSALDRDAFTFF